MRQVCVVDLVALGAGERPMRRLVLGVGDATVAAGALLDRLLGSRIVRIVAAHAGLAGIVLIFQDLGKAGRAGRVVAVANGAEIPSLGFEGQIFIRGLLFAEF